MSNAQYDPRPQGQGGPQAHTQAPSSPSVQPPAGGKPEPAFFRWIRESRVERTNDRVIAGVCGAIARELGWNVTLVRVLMVIAVFFGGFGGILYGLAWLLLPDELDHRILAEEIIAGRWDWAFIGVILCILIAGYAGFDFVFGWAFGVGWGINLMPTLLALLVLYLLVDNGRRRFLAPVAPPVPPAPSAPAGAPYAQQPQTPTNMYASGGAPVAMPPAGAPTQPAAPAQSQTVPRQPAHPQPAPAPQYYAQTAAAVPLPTPPAEPGRARRKPAGPMVVLLFFGLLLASAGVLALVLDDRRTFAAAVPSAVIYVGVVVAVLGVIVIALGCAGRRTGGLHPFVWILMFAAACCMALGGAWSLTNQYKNAVSREYTKVAIADGTKTIGSSSDDMKRLTAGLAVSGEGYERSVLDIDLSDYAKHNGKHTVELNNGKTRQTTCPVGTIPMTVEDARVVVTIPDGCSWGFISDLYTGTMDSYGDRYAIVSNANPFDALGEDGSLSRIQVETDSTRTRVHVPGIDVDVRHDGALDEDDEDEVDEDEVDEDDVSAETDGGYWFRSRRMARMCQGVHVTDGTVSFDTGADARTRRLVDDGYYWPCAVDADAAPASPELLIDPNVVIGGNITVRYASQR